MIVVDSSVIVTALADDSDADGGRFRRRLIHEELVAPELIDLEVTSAWRRLVRGGVLDGARADRAVGALRALPLVRVPHLDVLDRVWQLRGNFTTYDAAYVALAERLDVTLVTGDAKMASAPGLPCDVEVL